MTNPTHLKTAINYSKVFSDRFSKDNCHLYFSILGLLIVYRNLSRTYNNTGQTHLIAELKDIEKKLDSYLLSLLTNMN